VKTELALRGDRFELVSRVGNGASAQVWLAEAADGRRAAIKVGKSEAEAPRLAAEAERLLSADGPAFSRVLGAGWLRTGDQPAPALPYVALEWVEGEPLGTMAAGLAPGSEQRAKLALSVARDVGLALRELHAEDTVHGDVKQANILVRSELARSQLRFSARLVDFGLSADAGRELPEGATPHYLAPEAQNLDQLQDGRARDLWALGLVLAEILHPELTNVTAAGEAARTLPFPGELAAIVPALLDRAPAARPSAAFVFRRAEVALGEEGAAGAVERHRRAVRRAYLTVRRAELQRALRHAKVKVACTGVAAEWLSDALELGRSVASLRRPEPDGDRSAEIGDLDATGRRRWLVRLAGSAAASWPVASWSTDSALAVSLLSAVERVAPESLTLGDLAAEGTAPRRAPPNDPVELALALRDWSVDAAVLDHVERLVLEGAAPAVLALTLVRLLRLKGQLGRALVLLERLEGPASIVETAELRRRARDLDGARALLEANDANEWEPALRARRAATLGRISVDQGRPEAALGELGTLETPPTCEGRALAHLALGDVARAQGEAARSLALASDDEERARALALLGMVLHRRAAYAEALEHYRRAADHAARAGAVLEEASYLTGVAAAATQVGNLAEALEAARRALLLFEALGRGQEAGRAALSIAAVFACVRARAEAEHWALEAVERARAAGDVACRAYAHLAVSDALGTDREAVEHAERAAQLLTQATLTERLRVGARLARLGRPEPVGELDRLAQDPRVAAEARLEWWGSRAEVELAADSSEAAPRIIAELVSLATAAAPPTVRGPAFVAGAALASRAGDGEATRRFTFAASEAARALLAGAPDELGVHVQALEWVRRCRTPRGEGLAPEQLSDIQSLAVALSGRDRLRPLLDQVLDALVLWTGVERGLLLLRAPGERLRPRAARNLARSDLDGAQLELSTSLARRALELREPVVAVDAAGDLPEVHQSVHELKLRSVLAVPLIARGEALGVVYLDDRVRRGAFGPNELAWVRVVATLAALAIADARDQLSLRRSARRAERAEAKLSLELARREGELDVAERELARAREGRSTRFRYDAIVGKSERLLSLLTLVDRVTASEVPVLVIGESGSGKELVARAIHQNGPRGGEAFVSENCGAIPEGLLESTLFGHVRGAFTGASRPRAGLFEIAHRGTLFLDEIAEMSLGMQTKLLRVLEEGALRPVGSERVRRVDVRVIGATHRDLEARVKDGRFREDLYYRLNVITLSLPALRERRGDVPLLVRHFLAFYAKGRSIRVTGAALAALDRHAWPGNVRQLENEIRRAIVLADDVIDLEHLSAELRGGTEDIQTRTVLDLKSRVDALEAELLQEALGRTGGNQTRAAELLGVSRFGLQKMMKRLKIRWRPEACTTPRGELSTTP